MTAEMKAQIDEYVEQIVPQFKASSRYKDADEEVLTNTLKIYFKNQKKIDKSIEQEFVKLLLVDEDYDHFSFGHIIPLPQKISEEWVKSRLEFGNDEIVILHRKKQDKSYFMESYFYFNVEGEKYTVTALIHKDNIIKFTD